MRTKMGLLEGKTALVTGGRQGIGRGIADRFAEEGASVIITGRGARPADMPAHFDWFGCDVSDGAAVEALAADIGALDVLVNNAGVAGCPLDRTEEGFERQFGTNHLGHFLLTNLLMERLKETKDSRSCVPTMR